MEAQACYTRVQRLLLDLHHSRQTHHQQLLACMFWSLEVDVATLPAEWTSYSHPGFDFKVDSTGQAFFLNHRWIQQLRADVKELDVFDDLHELVERVGDDPSRLFFHDDTRELFCRAQLNVVRSCFLSVAIPPPNLLGPGSQLAAALTEKELPFVCDTANEDGTLCTRRFCDYRSLVTHQHRSHSFFNCVRALGTSNQCCICKSVFADREGCKRHLVRTANNGGQCRGQGNPYTPEIIMPETLTCPICAYEAQTFLEHQFHLPLHFPDLELLLQ